VLAVHRSTMAGHRSPVVAGCSPFAVERSSLAIRRSPLTVHRWPLAVRRPPFTTRRFCPVRRWPVTVHPHHTPSSSVFVPFRLLEVMLPGFCALVRLAPRGPLSYRGCEGGLVPSQPARICLSVRLFVCTAGGDGPDTIDGAHLARQKDGSWRRVSAQSYQQFFFTRFDGSLPRFRLGGPASYATA
jgi:hypothetical protein